MEAVLTRVTVPTVDFQDLVVRASKGSTFVPQIPLSNFMELEVKDKVMYARTTNNTNYLTTIVDFGAKYGTSNEEISLQDFKVTVDCKILSTMVTKLSSKTVTLVVENGTLIVQSNKGVYTFVVQTDENGDPVQFAQKDVVANGSSCHINANELRIITSQCSACRSQSKEDPSLFNFYFDNAVVITTDRSKACMSSIKASDRPILVSPAVMQLVSSICTEEYGVDICQDDENILFSSPAGQVFGPKQSQQDLQQYPAEAVVNKFANQDNYVRVQVNRTELLQALDRCTVFTDKDLQNALSLCFEPTGLTLNAQQSSSNAQDYVSFIKDTLSAELTEPIQFIADVKDLISIVSSCSNEALDVSFNAEAGVLIKTDSVIFSANILDEDNDF